MKMFNLNFSLFQRDSKQDNTIVINAKIDSSIERIKKDFSDGNFEEALTFLDKLLEENEKVKKAKYHLLLQKADFLRQLSKYDEFKEYIESIEKNSDYKPYIDNKFRELKLTILSMNKDTDFFEISKQLRLDTPKSKPQGHFDLVFYMNCGKLDKAKEIFDEEIKNDEFKKHLFLLGGHIYSSFYKYEDSTSQEYFDKADEFYQKALIEENLNFMNKYEIQTFYGTNYINNHLRQKNSVDLEYLKEYKKSLDNIYIQRKIFNSHFINSLLESYIYTLLILDFKDEYLKLYEENKDQLTMRHFVQYCEIKEISYSHEELQIFIKSDTNLQDLIIYASFIKDRDIDEVKQVVEFIEDNIDYIYKDSFVIYCFVSGSILLNKKIDESIIIYLEETKYQDIDSLLAYLKYQKYLGNNIDINDTDKLVELANNTNIYPRLLDTIELLSSINNRKYLQLSLEKEKDFKNIIIDTLKICENDKDLLFDSFNKFAEQIKNKDTLNSILGRIYKKYNKLNIAFIYFYKEYEKNKNINAMFEVLNISHLIYSKSGEKFEYQKQKEVFSSILGEVSNFEIQNLLFLLGYEITLLESASNILPILNQKLLEQDINELDNNLKISLSNIFVQTQFNMSNYKCIFLCSDNLCFEKDGVTYIKDNYNILEENTKNYSFKSIDNNEYFLKNSDDGFVKTSLFHRIVGVFAFRCDNPTFTTIKMDETKENPLEDFFSFLKNQTDNTKDLFFRYSNGVEIGLFPLSHSSYKNYFELIPFLLENKTYNFNAGKINHKDKSVNTMLTLSSIVFLNHIGYLEKVLNREDVYIQRTLINWLKEYSISIDVSNMPIEFNYLDDNNPKLYRNSEEEVNAFKLRIEKLIRLILENCNNKIIDDHLEILPIKGAYEILAKHIGSQEFQGFSFAINKKFQIITEDTIYNMMFDVFKYNKVFISNSLALLEDILTHEELRSLKITLHDKKYKYVLSEYYINDLVSYMKTDDIDRLQMEEYNLIEIADSYGWLNKIKQYHKNKFRVLYPKVNLPIKNRFDFNIEKILNYLD